MKKTSLFIILSIATLVVLSVILIFSINTKQSILTDSIPKATVTFLSETGTDITYRMDFTTNPTIKGTAFCNNENYYNLDQEVLFDASGISKKPSSKNLIFDSFYQARDVNVVGISASENFCSPNPISRVLVTDDLKAFCKINEQDIVTCKFKGVLRAKDELGNPVVAVFYGLKGGSATFSIPKENIECSENIPCSLGFNCDLVNNVCTAGEVPLKKIGFFGKILNWIKGVFSKLK